MTDRNTLETRAYYAKEITEAQQADAETRARYRLRGEVTKRLADNPGLLAESLAAEITTLHEFDDLANGLACCMRDGYVRPLFVKLVAEQYGARLIDAALNAVLDAAVETRLEREGTNYFDHQED